MAIGAHRRFFSFLIEVALLVTLCQQARAALLLVETTRGHAGDLVSVDVMLVTSQGEQFAGTLNEIIWPTACVSGAIEVCDCGPLPTPTMTPRPTSTSTATRVVATIMPNVTVSSRSQDDGCRMSPTSSQHSWMFIVASIILVRLRRWVRRKQMIEPGK